MAYSITRDYIKKGNARSGQKISKVRFIVSHDIGNGGSSAHNNKNYFNNHQPSASAHTFIDDKYILEIVPLNEKAWHVQYNKPIDNQMFGDDANDCAIGVELCHGGSINFQEAYKRYVWYHAYLCKKFALNPYKEIVGHYKLDPQRRTDPLNAFKPHGITWNKFISDVVNELNSKPVVKKEADSADGKLIRGEKGPNVKILNNMLYELGHTQAVNKDKDLFDGVTLNALLYFQNKHGLEVNGIYTTKVGEVMLQEIDKQDKEKGAVYRVQVGAFSNEKNAEKLADQLKTEGFNTYIVKE